MRYEHLERCLSRYIALDLVDDDRLEVVLYGVWNFFVEVEVATDLA